MPTAVNRGSGDRQLGGAVAPNGPGAGAGGGGHSSTHALMPFTLLMATAVRARDEVFDSDFERS